MGRTTRKGVGQVGRAGQVRARSHQPYPRSSRHPLHSWLVPLAVVAIVLLATIDDRHVGACADERQIIWSAVAITETGQMAQARGRDFTLVTADGQAVSRYGMGMTLAQIPAAFLAPRVEGWLGAGASQPLFLIGPLVLILAAAGFAGLAAHYLVGGASGP